MEELNKYIEQTKNFNKMRISVDGVLERISNKKGTINRSDKYMLKEINRLYQLGREAWLNGDLETVAEMFGILDI